MIQNIKLKDNNSLDGEIKTIKFGNRNIIIGPKGGGKSTLFDLLVNATTGSILSSTIEALEKYGLSLYSITIDNEEIPFNSLNKIKMRKGNLEKDKAKIYDNRNDVIYQDDNIKKNLTDTTKFDKKKMDFAKSIVGNLESVNLFINKIKEIYDAIEKIKLLDSKNINFSNTFKLTKTKKNIDEELIFHANYSSSDVVYKAEQDISLLNDERSYYKESINKLNFKINSYKTDRDTFISKEHEEFMIKSYSEIIRSFDLLKTRNKIERNKIKNIIKITNAFNVAYRKTVIDLKKKNENNENNQNILVSFKSESINHFKLMAQRLKLANKVFEDFLIQKLKLEFNEEYPAGDLLNLEINGDVVFSEDKKYDLLKVVLHNAKKTKTNIESWIISSQNKEAKDFTHEKLLNMISREVKKNILVTANGQEYETMSLGQKSIYGIKYKFNHSIGKPMFLDQPEDNLDNHTIATEVLKLINSKKEQFFIITHNANIGILSNPDKVIVGAFDKNLINSDPLNQYLEGKIKETDKPSETAYYLEGGIKYIINRLEILKGGE